MEKLSDLPNIGPVAVENLRKVGIETPEQLRAVGAEEAWLRIRTQVDDGACLHMLQGLKGAELGIKKSLLSAEQKAALHFFFKKIIGG